MSALILELKQGELMILNGATLRFNNRARVELSTQARFLFGKQIMQADDAVSPSQQIYYALQQAYVGAEEACPEALAQAKALIMHLRESTNATGVDILDQMLKVIAKGGSFEALKLARQLIRFETALAANIPGTIRE
jgi:flagellar protein FlbT